MRTRAAVLVGFGVVLLVVLGAAGWLAHLGFSARSDLEAARADLTTARTDLLGGDQAAVAAAVADAQARARSAASHTQDPLWKAASVLPWVGPTFQSASSIATVVDEVATQVLPGLVAVRSQLDPAKLRPDGTRIDPAPLAAAAPTLETLQQRVTAIESEAVGLPTSGVPGVVASAASSLQTTLAATRKTLDDALLAARLVPPMLGADGPRSYLLVLQSNNEARGTGGLVGGYGVLAASGGSLTITRIGPNNDLHSLTAPALDFGPAYAALYGADPALWPNVNLSPHYPYAAQLMLAMWQRQFGQKLDGVIAIDPVALSYLLAVTGPVKLADGSSVASGNVADLMMRSIYVRWPLASQDPERGRYQMEVGSAVVRELFSGRGSAAGLLEALGRAAAERRLLVYSAVSAEETALAGTVLGGSVSTAAGPYAVLVVNNGAGNKLDYYLGRSLSYALGACSATQQQSTITATLTNGAPASGLPPYASFRLDKGTGAAGQGGDGSTLEIVQVYAAVGAELAGATLDGAPVAVEAGTERGHAVFVLRVELAAGQARVLKLSLVEPASSATPVAWVQPLVVPARVTVTGTPCG